MNLENLKNNVIRVAKEKLDSHRFKGQSSGLSIFEVARLRDVVAGNVELEQKNDNLFFGLHSLN